MHSLNRTSSNLEFRRKGKNEISNMPFRCECKNPENTIFIKKEDIMIFVRIIHTIPITVMFSWNFVFACPKRCKEFAYRSIRNSLEKIVVVFP